MKVAELIERLLQLPQGAYVSVPDGGQLKYGTTRFCPAEIVRLESRSVVVIE